MDVGVTSEGRSKRRGGYGQDALHERRINKQEKSTQLEKELRFANHPCRRR